MPDYNPSQPPFPHREDAPDILLASRKLFQRGLADVLRSADLGPPALIDAFTVTVGEVHDKLLAVDEDSEIGQSLTLTASKMTLMADDDLEIDIRITDIGRHLREAAGTALGRCRMRYMTLLQQPQIPEATNPLGSETICAGLSVIAGRLEGGTERIVAVLERLERDFSLRLPALYREIDAFLDSREVDMASAGTRRARGAHGTQGSAADFGQIPAQGNGANPLSGNALSALQQLLSQRVGGAGATGPERFSVPTPAGDGVPNAGNAALDTVAMVMLNHLFDRLTMLESKPSTALAVEASTTEPTPPQAVKSVDLDLAPGKPEAIAIDTMAMIFKGIFDSDDLADIVKSAIGRLQIPILKRAIIDPSLFADRAHPVRLLIDRMARAAVGLPAQTAWEHPVGRRIGAVAAAVAPLLEKKGVALDSYLTDLETLSVQRDQAIRSAAEPLVRLIESHENSRYAAPLVNEWLEGLLARTPSPDIASFLEKYWQRVMRATAEAAGANGPRWQQDRETAEQLIWSVAPKQTPDDRKRLAGVASSLLKRINAGLDSIGVSAVERRPFLNILFDLQTTALRTQAPDDALSVKPAAVRRPAAGEAVAQGNAAELLESEDRRVHYLGIPSSAKLPWSPSRSDWQVGDWLRFAVSDKQFLTGLCCWQSSLSGVVLFYNRDWRYGVARPHALIDHQCRTGRAQVVSRVSIFDAAAERALDANSRS